MSEVAPVLRAHALAPADVLFQNEFQLEQTFRGANRKSTKSRGAFAWVPNEGMEVSGALRAEILPGRAGASVVMAHLRRDPAAAGRGRSEALSEIWWRIYLRHDAAAVVENAELARLVGIAGSNGHYATVAKVASDRGGALRISAHAGAISQPSPVTTEPRRAPRLLATGHGKSRVLHPSEAGRWICLEARVSLNQPGKSNGAFDLWVDGRRECALTGLRWQGGGGSGGIGAFVLESGSFGRASGRSTIWLDNLVLAAAEIGPVVASAGCSAYRTTASVDFWQVQVGTGPNAREAVWTSAPLRGREERCALDAPFRARVIYWLRTRDRRQPGGWSRWSAWHAPFAIR